MNIPKKIHYCWFGGKPLPEDAKKYIESWKKYCPDYEIIEWNESNFDLNSNMYVKEAYEARKWAFITDYVRLYVMYNYGGIYMDTDVEVLKKLDVFLENDAFSGFESNKYIPTGIMACKKGFKLFGELLDYYTNKHFKKENGDLDLTTNVITITNICKKHGLVLNNKQQNVDGFMLYPAEYFCPKDYKTGEINVTENTYTIHHFSGSWLEDEDKEIKVIHEKVLRKYNRIKVKFLRMVLIRITSVINVFFYRIKKRGIKDTIKHYLKRIKKENVE